MHVGDGRRDDGRVGFATLHLVRSCNHRPQSPLRTRIRGSVPPPTGRVHSTLLACRLACGHGPPPAVRDRRMVAQRLTQPAIVGPLSKRGHPARRGRLPKSCELVAYCKHTGSRAASTCRALARTPRVRPQVEAVDLIRHRVEHGVLQGRGGAPRARVRPRIGRSARVGK